MTDKERVLEFLLAKTGWIKKNASDLSMRLSKLGIDVSPEECRELQSMARMALKGEQPKEDVMRRKRLFFDIETSPNVVLSWRIGNKVSLSHENIIQERAIICVSWKWEHDDRVFTLTWDENQCDRELVRQFVEVLHSADECVAHNGDSYDVPWVRARAFYHGIPVSPYVKSVDTKRLASNMYLNSRRLDYISKFLGGEGKIHTEYEMWKKILLNNDKKALHDMVVYCEQDVRELEDIYHELKSYNAPFTHNGVIQGKTKCSCHECGSTDLKYHRMLTTPKGSITHELICGDCNSFMTITDSVYRQHGFVK